ncbi:hypothetical protein OQL93_101 [Saccharomyces cerevisiae synthetic construct]|uniref:Putative uncharacterized protein YIL071W-A n=1 Tax=Saccharomyces cerevisiae (strain ATCC 204508 / S288c) TaxID=559292 RepID=YI070_YEAST|nr:RecName: Full=Putative uncharacterized protein YIL071W-A [Saccharomyces cerevisiae S288C]pir/S53572/ probable membrane protein YIL071w-a - yeast (Saccharomyces cerevisiae) [Saccharomyces cerevisiae]EWG85329.1 hypothetical protein R008_I10656 [Saccharomyces cerevisiae R008]WHM58802.1 hypothetical protein OQL93_101 [Saccharomyces cerevisiae synthetic construct]AHX39316.1 hypothetical protein YIL071W-A [Saccharomyces cerevisiae]KZV10543.1 hypothetical protein WN66_03188 [Saccharomyces cerevisi
MNNKVTLLPPRVFFCLSWSVMVNIDRRKSDRSVNLDDQHSNKPPSESLISLLSLTSSMSISSLLSLLIIVAVLFPPLYISGLPWIMSFKSVFSFFSLSITSFIMVPFLLISLTILCKIELSSKCITSPSISKFNCPDIINFVNSSLISSKSIPSVDDK